MHPKIKRRRSAIPGEVRPVRPLVLHDVTNSPFRPNLRQSVAAIPAGAGPANHARHHVARQAQA